MLAIPAVALWAWASAAGARISADQRATFLQGEIADNLSRLYGFCQDRLVEANVAKSRDGIDDAEKVIREIREAWVAAAEEMASTRTP